MPESFAVPGDLLCSEGDCTAGEGAYIKEGKVYSALAGRVHISDDEKGKSYAVHSLSCSECDPLITVGSAVLCRVTKVQMNQVRLDIIAAGENRELKSKSKGIIRREDIRLTDLDSIITSACFRPGDIVRASVLSLGDARQFYLSTAAAELGVLWALNAENGNVMTSCNWKVWNVVLIPMVY